MKYIILVGSLVITSCFMACNAKSSANQTKNNEGKEYTSAYICPMHCDGSGSSEMGECPVCGMDYVANEADSSEK